MGIRWVFRQVIRQVVPVNSEELEVSGFTISGHVLNTIHYALCKPPTEALKLDSQAGWVPEDEMSAIPLSSFLYRVKPLPMISPMFTIRYISSHSIFYFVIIISFILIPVVIPPSNRIEWTFPNLSPVPTPSTLSPTILYSISNSVPSQAFCGPLLGRSLEYTLQEKIWSR